MGDFTTQDAIWYPGLTDVGQPNVNMATMAGSIMNGIGKRLRLQETVVGLKASIPTNTAIQAQSLATLPFSVGGGGTDLSDFNLGFTFSGGVATVQTPGMYQVSVALTHTNVASNSVAVQLSKNAKPAAYSETPTSSSFYVTAQTSCILNCAVGDTISTQGKSVGPNTHTAVGGVTCYFTIALIKATQ